MTKITSLMHESFSSQRKLLNDSWCFSFFILLVYRHKISDNDVCPQLDHMFLRSPTIPFWKTFQNWLTDETKQQPTLANSMILHGVFEQLKQFLLELGAS